MSATPHLDRLSSPADLRGLSVSTLRQVADELRAETISAVAKTGGHLGAGLGVVELTVALHSVFHTPEDRVIWDVGHQAYPHKILTGRRGRMESLRQEGGLSGFVKRSESAYDPFGTAHSSTSISAGLGMAKAAQLKGQRRFSIAVIGDGAMTGGMAYEALNHAGQDAFHDNPSNLIVVLNDNNMSIDPPTGALSGTLSKVVSSDPYLGLRSVAKRVASKLPPVVEQALKGGEAFMRRTWQAEQIGQAGQTGQEGNHQGGALFEALGFFYLGPIDGHDLDQLIPVLANIRDGDRRQGPFLVHVLTEKGKGYAPAEAAADKYHGVAKFDVKTGQQSKPKPNAKTYTQVFAESLIQAAEIDPQIVAVTAAMPSGTGLNKFAAQFPDRCFDVGIAEQHGVTFAAGLACEGLKPFVAIYSTFLQRAYDQIIHDVAIQNLPVRFCLDRAGFVGADGQTHQGLFDLAYLSCIPNMVVMAPADEGELARMVATAAAHDAGPSAIRYPRGEGVGAPIPAALPPLELGKGRVIAGSGQGDLAICSLGTRLEAAQEACARLEGQGYKVTLADMRFAKPLDARLIADLAQNHRALITVEEGSSGGFGDAVLRTLMAQDLLGSVKIRTLHVTDAFIDQASPTRQAELGGVCSQSILNAAKEIL